MSAHDQLPRDELPAASEKDLQAINRLMMDKQYRIKAPAGPFGSDRQDRLNPDFVMYTLNDFLGHVQNCVASTRRILPGDEHADFYARFRASDEGSFRVMAVARGIDIKSLSALLLRYQQAPRELTVRDLVPLVRGLFSSIIKVYYLGSVGVARAYRSAYALVTREFVPANPDAMRQYATVAIEEWRYIFERVVPGLYPLLLRMTSPSMLSMNQLLFSNGSRVLSWLGVSADEVVRAVEGPSPVETPPSAAPAAEVAQEEEGGDPNDSIPEEAREGLEILEMLFPEAGWFNLSEMPDMCGYFQPILGFQDGFNQLAPENPLHLTMILLWILEELFHGLRLVRFEPLEPTSTRDEYESVDKIIEDWILYQETIFDKSFIVDLKEFTHQIYTQPEYRKNPYGRRLLSNMYTLTKSVFLPYFDVSLYGTVRSQKDERLPPFYARVKRLARSLDRYNEYIRAALDANGGQPGASVDAVQNPWAPYKFDIPNPVSRRLDAICGGPRSKGRTNALLIQYTLAILNVLNWWINDRDSFAYASAPEQLYRVVEPGSTTPAFGVHAREDVTQLFNKHLRAMYPGAGTADAAYSPLVGP